MPVEFVVFAVLVAPVMLIIGPKLKRQAVFRQDAQVREAMRRYRGSIFVLRGQSVGEYAEHGKRLLPAVVCSY